MTTRGALDTSTLILLGRITDTESLPGEAYITAVTHDALIAATAVANDMPVHTCNPTDFDGIDSLEVIRVPHPDH